MKRIKQGNLQLGRIKNGVWVYSAISIMWIAACAVIMLLLLFADTVDYNLKQAYSSTAYSRILLCAVVAIVWCSCIAAFKMLRIKKHIVINVGQYVRWFSVILFVVQLYICYNLYFLTGWDPEAVRYTSECIAVGGQMYDWSITVYSRYPNNLLLVLVEALIMKLHDLVPVFTYEYDYMAVVAVNCFLITFSCYQLFSLLKKLIGEGWALGGWIICVALVGLSPWMMIPYSDTFGLIFPVMILNIYLSESQSNLLKCGKWASILSIAVAGYFIKPQCIIVFIALLLVYLARHISKSGLLKFGCIILSFVLLFVIGNAALTTVAERNGLSLNEEGAFGFAHFLMMGLNNEFNGGYFHDDVEYSDGFATKSERTSANLQVVAERIESYGFVGLMQHFIRKILTAFNDGMFAWGLEGSFYVTISEAPNDTIAPWMRSVFYSNGSNYITYASSIHTIWIGVLLMATLSFLHKPQENKRDGIAIVRLSLLGLILFELLFEVRSRYLFTYVPFFVCMAVCGLRGLSDTLVHRMKKA